MSCVRALFEFTTTYRYSNPDGQMDMELPNPFDISPVSYLDSIMNCQYLLGPLAPHGMLTMNSPHV